VGTALLLNLLRFSLIAIWLLVLGRVLVSFLDAGGRSRGGAFLVMMTEPILAPVRRVMPSTGVLDFSPLVVCIVLSVFIQALT
jgi:YggT family protein